MSARKRQNNNVNHLLLGDNTENEGHRYVIIAELYHLISRQGTVRKRQEIVHTFDIKRPDKVQMSMAMEDCHMETEQK